MASPHCIPFTMLILSAFFPSPIAGMQLDFAAANERHHVQVIRPSSSPFESALQFLQKQIGYDFKRIGFLRRAMTHSSFSEENNRALGILGGNAIDASVSLLYLVNDLDISSKDLNRRLAEISNVETSCAVDGMRLGLHKVVRVSPKTNSSTPTVVCGAFRAIFGAMALDTGKFDEVGNAFWKVHKGEGWRSS